MTSQYRFEHFLLDPATREQFAAAMRATERYNVPEDLVAIAVPYLTALIEASQLDSARVVGGRIASWADRDLRAALAQAQLFRALGEEDAARKADESTARLSGDRLSEAATSH
ncbi:MAG: hypothetical protein ACHP7D_00375 [Lysobacterales bacterium]